MSEKEMAMVALMTTINEAKHKDAQIALKFERNKTRARDEWEKLSDAEKAQKTALGLNYTEGKFRPPNKWVRHLRRGLRYKLFRIREGKWKDDPELEGLKELYEAQFQEGWTMNDFTFEWDVSSIDPLKVITYFEWDGDVIEISAGTGKFCDPAAFTKQEM